jgi:hypothetical protein
MEEVSEFAQETLGLGSWDAPEIGVVVVEAFVVVCVLFEFVRAAEGTYQPNVEIVKCR